MVSRRRLLSAISLFLSLSLSGCLDTFTGGEGGLSGGGGGDIDDERREIVQTYDDALVARNDALGARDEGITAFNEESYAAAIEAIETAAADIERAQSGFAESVDLAREIAEDAATSLCETAAEETDLQVAATEAALAAATAADEDADAGTINGHIEEYRSRRSEASERSVEDTDAVASALGLE
ncbi:hypothetical protein [Halorubrum trueperi]|uniref:DUF4398 domain-containing protein n=1 Tax=Halorubrum trueperi TaxID=2004704 RepID=A0ABD5UE98_9EURY